VTWGKKGETFPARYAGNGSKDLCCIFRDNKDMNYLENYKGNLEDPKNELEC
jgi:hypothetical protein